MAILPKFVAGNLFWSGNNLSSITATLTNKVYIELHVFS